MSQKKPASNTLKVGILEGREPIVLALILGLIAGIVFSIIFYFLYEEKINKPFIDYAVKATLAAQPTLPSIVEPLLLSLSPTAIPITTTVRTIPAATATPTVTMTATPTIQPIKPFSTPVIDSNIQNDLTTWKNPTDIMYITAPKEIVITIDPENVYQATCSWDIQPTFRSISQEDECSITFIAVSDEITTVTVTIDTKAGVESVKTFTFHP